jgi:toxin CptA
VSSRIELSLSPSRAAGVLAALPWLILMVFSSVAAPASSLWLLLMLVPAAILAVRQFRRCGLLRGAGAVVALQADADNLTCRIAGGETRSVRICSSSSLGASFLALKLRPADTTSGTMFVLVLGASSLFGANAPETDFRRLRMWLRAGQPATA